MVENSSIQLRYALLERIGKGSNGVIWIARTITDDHPLGLDKLCVLKFPVRNLDEEINEQIIQLRNEYALLNLVQHPNVVRMIEYEESNPYLALEYANAKCLISYLSNDKRHSFNDEMWSRFYFKQVMEGLKAVRDNNVAHLDVKIDNVFMNISLNDEEAATDSPILQIKIGDFGMAKDNVMNIKGKCGCAYRAPEIL